MAVTPSAAQLFSTSELPVNPVFDPPSSMTLLLGDYGVLGSWMNTMPDRPANSRSGVGVEMEKLEPP